MWKRLWLPALLCATIALAAEDKYTTDKLMAALDKTDSDSAAVVVLKEYARNAKDIDVLRTAQDRWRAIDSNGVRKYFDDQLKKNPKSAKHLYLAGRLMADEIERIKAGRKIVGLDSTFSYGYRLCLTPYQPLLMGAGPDEARAAKLKAELATDAPLYAKWARNFPRDDAALSSQFGYLMYEKKYEDAEKVFDKAHAIKQSWANTNTEIDLYVKMERYENARLLVEEMMTERKKAGKLTEKEYPIEVAMRYCSALGDAGAYEKLVSYLTGLSGWESMPPYLFQLVYYSEIAGKRDEAIRYLQMYAVQGDPEFSSLGEDEKMKGLVADARWKECEEAWKKAFVAGEPKRKELVLADKISQPAPGFILPTASEKDSVWLEKLKGNVVILDFWATWCGPCRMAMPVIDQFTKKKPEGVRVFSVNVWERGDDRSKPISFMKENGYAMELLFGTRELTDKYGVAAIPTLFVIDKQGNIRYKEIGYSNTLDEKLRWWVEDLSK